MKSSLRPAEGRCLVCGKSFQYKYRAQGGGKRRKYCSHACVSKRWTIENSEKRKAIVLKYEAVPENKERKRKRNRERKLAQLYNWTVEEFRAELLRQNYRCFGCLGKITEETARVDHSHETGKVRGLLCDSCNWVLGHAKEDPGTLRRLMAYLDRDRGKKLVYLVGALKNQRVPHIGNLLRSAGFDVMDEWFTPGKEADLNWQAYETLRGRSYSEALRGRSATNTFLFDRSYIDMADVVILAMPAGKSAMLELGYAKGMGKKSYLFLDGVEPERYDIMPGFVDKVLGTEEDLMNEMENYK